MPEQIINPVEIMMVANLVNNMAGNSASAAKEAKEDAEAAAALAATHNYGISVSGTTLVITEPSE